MATVTFYGACGCVTGSCTHLSWGEHPVLVDCGLYQGDEELEQRNWSPFPFRPTELTAVVAHPRPPRPHRPAAPPGRRGLLRPDLLHQARAAA